MAQLNGYTNSEGVFVDVPFRPTDQYDPNGIARITPEASRHYAKEAYKIWADSQKGVREKTRFGNILDGSNVAWAGGTYISFTAGTVLGYIWFTHNNVGADPAPALHTNFGHVDVNTTDTGIEIAENLYKVLRDVYDIETTYIHGTTQVEIFNLVPSDVTNATTTTGVVITVTILEQGVDPVTTPWDGQYTDADGAQNLNYR